MDRFDSDHYKFDKLTTGLRINLAVASRNLFKAQ